MKIQKSLLSLAGEYAVASELCRREIYAQPTFGNLKKTDILSFDGDKMSRYEVKSKQGNIFANCRGTYGDAYLIFVDFQNKDLDERPDFYILTSKDWLELIYTICGDRIAKGDVKIDEENCPVFVNEIIKSSGKPYRGLGIKTKYLESHKERWDKVK